MFSTAIMMHPKRVKYKDYLLSKLENATIVMDRGKGLWDTSRRAWLAHDKSKKYHLVIQDDAIICDRFIERVNEAMKKKMIYSFYHANRPTFKKEIKTGLREGCIVKRHIHSGLAMAMPVEFIDGMIKFCDRLRRPEDDVRIGTWAKSMKLKNCIIIPSLVNHRQEKSLHWNNRLNKYTKAYCYVGENKADKLYFGQQHIGTWELFGERYFDIPIIKTPHFKFLKGDSKAYGDYLKASWAYKKPKRNTLKDRIMRGIKFLQLMDDIKRNGLKKPIKVCSFNNKDIIFDGNHRAAIMAFLEKEINREEMPVREYIKEITKNTEEFYGTRNKSMPYQSIYFKGKELLAGRRRDLLKRMECIDKQDIEGKTILDIGCNIGSASFLACEAGAKKVIGIDVSGKILTSAIRLNVLFGYPCYFYKRDFSKRVEFDERIDTAFAFSVDRHIKNNDTLLSNLKNFDTIYFETHQNGVVPDNLLKYFKAEFRGTTCPKSCSNPCKCRGKRKIYKLTTC